MSEREIEDVLEPPSDDLRALFAQERDVSVADRAAIRNKLATTVGQPVAATTIVASSKPLWIAAAAIAAIAGIWWATRDDKPNASRAPVIETAPPLAPEPSAPELPAEPAAEPQAPPPTAPAQTVAPAPAPGKRVAPAPSQTELLAKAWQALTTSPTETLRLVELDLRLHPRGALVEERDALRIQALAALGRRADARELATRFLDQHPRSVHRKAVERSLVEAP
jgi:hypothetical protein